MIACFTYINFKRFIVITNYFFISSLEVILGTVHLIMHYDKFINFVENIYIYAPRFGKFSRYLTKADEYYYCNDPSFNCLNVPRNINILIIVKYNARRSMTSTR